MKEILERYTSRVPEEELRSRVAKFQKMLQADCALLFHPPDIYYYCGSKQEGFLLIPKDKEPVFFVIKHAERARWETPFEVVPIKGAKQLGEKIAEAAGTPKAMATELDLITLNLFNRLKKMLPETEIVDASGLVRKQKAVKSQWEIEVLKKCGEMLKDAYLKTFEALEEGMTELELNAMAMAELRKRGHEYGEVMRGGRMDGFVGHILSGVAAAVPSYMNAPLNGIGISPAMPTGPSFKKIERGETVLFDFFGTRMGYLVDMTRTFGLAPIPEKLKGAYRVVQEIHAYLKENLKAGASTLRVYEEVLKIAENSPYGENFMGYPGNRVNFIGHGVGTEINDFPFLAKGLDMELEENMVIAVEPKFLFPDLGAAGLENTYLITNQGAVSLTPAPEDLLEK